MEHIVFVVELHAYLISELNGSVLVSANILKIKETSIIGLRSSWLFVCSFAENYWFRHLLHKH